MDAFFHTMSAGSSVYIARLLLNKDEMRARDIDPPYLQHLLESRLGFRAHVIGSETTVSSGCCDGYHHIHDMANKIGDGDSSGAEALLVRKVTVMLLDQIVVGGHHGITDAYEREVQTWNEERECNETVHVIDAMGSSMLETASLLPVIDATTTTCNDPHEVARCLGIEAAMATIHGEIDAVMSFDSSKVEKRHVQLVADEMTHRGYIKPMSRHGMNRPGSTCGALVQARLKKRPMCWSRLLHSEKPTSRKA